MVANNARKNKYCTVCQTKYEDYLEHIETYVHKVKINKSVYTHYIKEKAMEFEQARKVKLSQAMKILANRKNLEETEHEDRQVRVMDPIQEEPLQNQEESVSDFFKTFKQDENDLDQYLDL